MDYQKIHDAIIDRARDRLVEGYTERHHIIPRCMGGTDDPENLIQLTAREHFVVHQLLVKLHPKHSKLIFAAKMMCASNNFTRERVNNRMYEWLREKCRAAAIGKPQSDEKREKCRAAAIGRPKSKETIEKHRAAAIGRPKSKETIEKLRVAATGKPQSDEKREKCRVAATGRPKSKETIEKLRVAATGRYVSDETREKNRIAATGRYVSDETRENMSIAQKQYHQRRKEGLTQQAAVC